MKVTLVCSCGLLLAHNGRKLLIDGLTERYAPFYDLPDEERLKLHLGQPPFDGLTRLAFTHRHPDHFSERGVRDFCMLHRHLHAFIPETHFAERGQSIDTETGAQFEFFRFPHTPVPEELMTDHFVLFITVGGKCVYVTADAAPDAELHKAVMRSRKIDAAFWNPQVLSHPEMRQLMRECVVQNYIYHVPIDPPDQSGIRRKCMKNMERFSAELPNVTVLDRYPTELEI